MQDLPTKVEVAIIGAGVSGLSTACGLYDAGQRDFVVFETSEMPGGRTRMSRIAGEYVPGGAGVVYVGTETDEFCERHGIERYPIRPSIYCVHYKGVTVTAGNDAQLAAGLPFSRGAKAEFLTLLMALRADYGRLMDRGLGAASDALEKITFEAYLGSIQHDELREFMVAVVYAACHLRADAISAKYALRYFLSKVFRDAEQSSYIPKGMQEIPLAMHRAVSENVFLQTRVCSIALDEHSKNYHVIVERAGSQVAVEARHLVFAIPGPEVAKLAPWLPDWKLSAIEGVGGAAQLVVSLVLQHDGNWDWEGVFMTPVIGLSFDWVTDCRAGTGLTDKQTTLQLGVARERALDAFGLSDDDIVRRWVSDLDQVFPGSAAQVVAAEVHRWPLCFAVVRADRHEFLDDAVRANGRAHFAGDYACATAGVHGCITSSKRVVDEILDEDPH